MPETITPESVTALLVALGDTPHKIAKSLRALGIAGDPGEPDRCPLAAYLKKGDLHVDVCDDVICWFDPTTGDSDSIETSKAVQGFIKKFDKGGYRFLRAPVVPE